MKATKKYIQRELPADRYKLVDSYSLGEGDYITCENCGKVIRNIGIVEDSKGRRFCVGLDCAATLSGISEWDIEYYNQGFNVAKSIRAKIRRETKKGANIVVRNYYYTKAGQVEIVAETTKGTRTSRWTLETVTTDFLKKYLPELAKVARVNTGNFQKLNDREFKINNGDTFNGYTFRYEVRRNEYGTLYAYAEIMQNGQVLKTGSNGGDTLDSCQTECARLYNDVAFAAGMHPLS